MSPTCPGQNRLLAALPERTLAQLRMSLDPVLLNQGEMLRETGSTTQHAYFPTTAQVSAQYLLASGVSAEFALVGSEGLVGVESYLGGGKASSAAIVVTEGLAYRIRENVLLEAFEREPAVKGLLLRYAQALINQIGQTALCNRHHSLEQQLFRSLLGCADRSHSHDIAMTHELLARRLGVRREGVSEAAYRAQEAGLIRYRRGHITILDRTGLEARVCECYHVLRREYARLLPEPAPGAACAVQSCTTCAVPADRATSLHVRTAPVTPVRRPAERVLA